MTESPRAPRFAWVGFHVEGVDALAAVLAAGHHIDAVFTLQEDVAAKKSGHASYTDVCAAHGVPLHFVKSINSDESRELLRALDPDYVFVIGWTELVRPDILALARGGFIGAHASLLPHNRGRAPVNWAIIRGERETGNTMMWLVAGADRGDIIDQRPIAITPYDTCGTIYDRVADTNRDIILELIPRLVRGERPGAPQPETHEEDLPRRRPQDGRIDWNVPAQRVYDFIRGISRPYPGAFSDLEQTRWTIWSAALVDVDAKLGRPGENLGAVYATNDAACGQLVACATGAIAVLECERDGTLLSGRALSDQQWKGSNWISEETSS